MWGMKRSSGIYWKVAIGLAGIAPIRHRRLPGFPVHVWGEVVPADRGLGSGFPNGEIIADIDGITFFRRLNLGLDAELDPNRPVSIPPVFPGKPLNQTPTKG